MAKILIVDDDEGFVQLVSQWMQESNHEVITERSPDKGLSLNKETFFDVVIIDVSPPHKRSVWELIPLYIKGKGLPKVIIVSESFDPEKAEYAIKRSAWDSFEKPPKVKFTSIPKSIQRLKDRILSRVNYALEIKNQMAPSLEIFKREEIVGNSFALTSSLAKLADVAKTDDPILLRGETGTGKELFAKAAHKNSFRKGGNFVPFNCASVPDKLAESILFGYKAGAFTDATEDRDGLIKEADRGTLFLDEIGELSLSNQANLLRCFQEKEVLPLQANQPEKTDFRIISATNENLEEMIEKGKFRNDLYHRVCTYTIEIPSLREHREDIRDIAEHLIKKFCKERVIGSKNCTEEFIQALENYDWPGNVRQLESEIKKAISNSYLKPTMDVYHLSAEIRAGWIAKVGHKVCDDDEINTARRIETEQQRIETAQRIFSDEFIKERKKELESVSETTRIVKTEPGGIPTREEVEANWFKELKEALKNKRITEDEAVEKAGMSRSSLYRKFKDYGL